MPSTKYTQGKIAIHYLPPELKDKVLSFLPIIDLCKMCLQSRAWKELAEKHMATRKVLDFTQTGKRKNHTSRLTNRTLTTLLKKCSNVEEIKGFFPKFHKKKVSLTPLGVYSAFRLLKQLKTLEINDSRLLLIMANMRPLVHIPAFRVSASETIKESMGGPPGSVWELNLNVGALEFADMCLMSGLPTGLRIESLSLNNVHLLFEKLDEDFSERMPNLKALEIRNCRFHHKESPCWITREEIVSQLIQCPNLEELHLVQIDTDCETSFTFHPRECKLKRLILGRVQFMDHEALCRLLQACHKTLETLYIPRYLCDDILMELLQADRVRFPSLKHLVLGYGDEEFKHNGICLLTDIGMEIASRLFYSPQLRVVEIRDCFFLRETIKLKNLTSGAKNTILSKAICKISTLQSERLGNSGVWFTSSSLKRKGQKWVVDHKQRKKSKQTAAPNDG